jgi:glutathione synthase/RimK-type ligase-like ATP-grasp enzyme
MILVHANESDLSANYVCEWLLYHNCDFERSSNLDFEKHHLDRFDKILNRKAYDFSAISDKCVFDYCFGKSKLDILELAQTFGLMIPETHDFSTNQHHNQRDSRQWVVKPKNQVQTYESFGKKYTNYTTIIDDFKDLKDNHFEMKHYIMQEYIKPLYEVRTYFFNGNFFSIGMAIEKDLDNKNCDVRHYVSLNLVSYERIEIPLLLKNNLKKMMNYLNINFAGIDLIFDGVNYYFLELNQHAQFEYHCKIGNLGIAKNIAEYSINMKK